MWGKRLASLILQILCAILQQLACWPNGKALDYGSRDCRFESCVGQFFFAFYLLFPLSADYKHLVLSPPLHNPTSTWCRRPYRYPVKDWSHSTVHEVWVWLVSTMHKVFLFFLDPTYAQELHTDSCEWVYAGHLARANFSPDQANYIGTRVTWPDPGPILKYKTPSRIILYFTFIINILIT